MRRAPLVLAGTVAGIVGVLAFPVHSARVALTSAGTSSTTGGASTPATGSASTGRSAATGTRSATGDDETFQFGELAVTVTVDGSKITNVGMATLSETDGRSASIDGYAIPQLEQEVISAGSANVNAVSGATFTSQAFEASLSSALSKLGFSG